MSLELTTEELLLLDKLLEHYRGELSMEIADTDNSRFRDDLRREQHALERLIEKARAGATAAR
jgi:hypothetical protein